MQPLPSSNRPDDAKNQRMNSKNEEQREANTTPKFHDVVRAVLRQGASPAIARKDRAKCRTDAESSQATSSHGPPKGQRGPGNQHDER